MAKEFPQNKFLEGIFAPVSFEFNIHDCTVIGQIPPELMVRCIVSETIYNIKAPINGAL